MNPVFVRRVLYPAYRTLRRDKVLAMLAGRVYDVVRAPNGNVLGGTFWGHILKQGIGKFQVTQAKLDKITIVIVPTAEFGDGTETYVLDKVRQACGDKMKVVFELRKDIDLTPSGKHRYIISSVTRQHEAAPKT